MVRMGGMRSVRLISLLLFLMVWQGVAVIADSNTLPSPWAVFVSFWGHLAAGDLLSFGVEERPVYLYGHQIHPSTVL